MLWISYPIPCQSVLPSSDCMPSYITREEIILGQMRIPLILTYCHRYHFITNRHDQLIFIHCRIGHTRFTRSYLLTRIDASFCIYCNASYSVYSFLFDCHALAEV